MAIGKYLSALFGATIKKQNKLVIESGMFDEELYLMLYPDVKAAKITPVEHFLRYGWKEGKYPSAVFSPDHYLKANPDVKQSGQNPFIHYIRFGKAEQRPAISKKEMEKLAAIKKVLDSGLWDADYYLARNDDVKSIGLHPLMHFLESGGFEGRNPSEHFNSRFYLEEYADVKQSGMNPLVHYITTGREEGRPRLPEQKSSEQLKQTRQKPVFQFHIDEFKRLTHHGENLDLFVVSGWCHTKPDVAPDLIIRINDVEIDRIVPEVEREDVIKLFGKTSFPNGFLKVFSVKDMSADLAVIETNTNHVLLSGRVNEIGILREHELSDHEYSGYLAFSKIPDELKAEILKSSGYALNPVHRYFESVFIPMMNVLARPGRDENGYNVFGFFSKITGISEVARAFTNSLMVRKESFVLADYFEPSHKRLSEAEERIYQQYYYKPFIYDKNVLMIDWRMLRELTEKIPEILKGKKNIVAFWWEFETGFEDKIDILNEFDEVYVFSDFIKDVLSRLESRDFKITKIKYPFYKNWEIIEEPGAIRKKFGLEGKFCFFFNFHYASGFRRKNPIATLEALYEEFPGEDNVVYFVKTNRINGNIDSNEEFLSKVREFGLENRVIIHDEPLSRDGFMTLLNAMDCYISLHRGEGLGLGILEAYALNKPVIATNYGGNTEYMDNPLGHPVPYKLIKAEDDFDVYASVKEWAEPDKQFARKVMRQLYNEHCNMRNPNH